MRHTQEQCAGMHCKCMYSATTCGNNHYSDHVLECGHTPTEHQQTGCAGDFLSNKRIVGRWLLTYEQSLEARRLGFPQNIIVGSVFTLEDDESRKRHALPDDRTFASDVDSVAREWRLLRPDISRIIEEIGPKFEGIRKVTREDGTQYWLAESEHFGGCAMDGESPIVAAAQLWIHTRNENLGHA